MRIYSIVAVLFLNELRRKYLITCLITDLAYVRTKTKLLKYILALILFCKGPIYLILPMCTWVCQHQNCAPYTVAQGGQLWELDPI